MHRAGRRILHLAQTLPERGFLFRHYLSGDGSTGGNVPGNVRHPAHSGLAGAMARDDHRPGAKDHPPTPDLCWTAAPGITKAKGLAARQPLFSTAQVWLELMYSRKLVI